MMEITPEEYRKKNERNEDSLRDLWDNIENTNICIIRVPERREEREKGPEKIFEGVIVENFPNMEKETGNKIPGKIYPRRNTLRHIVIKLTKIKDKDKLLKATGKNDKEHTRKLP